MTTYKCQCGRRRGRYAPYCRKCTAERVEERRTKARAVVRTGACPWCGSKLRSNLALAGWWQCEQFGAEGFRARAYEPSCDFQIFTE